MRMTCSMRAFTRTASNNRDTVSFYCVDATSLATYVLCKFSNFGLLANILHWIIDFLVNRQQLCKLGSVLTLPVIV